MSRHGSRRKPRRWRSYTPPTEPHAFIYSRLFPGRCNLCGRTSHESGAELKAENIRLRAARDSSNQSLGEWHNRFASIERVDQTIERLVAERDSLRQLREERDRLQARVEELEGMLESVTTHCVKAEKQVEELLNCSVNHTRDIIVERDTLRKANEGLLSLWEKTSAEPLGDKP